MRIEKLRRLLSLSALLAVPAFMYGSANPPAPQSLEAKVRHQLNMLPYYGVFDNLSFRVDGNKVTLFGEVARPVLKSDAESAVKHIEGVSQVEGHIEVLPLSNSNHQIPYPPPPALYDYPLLAPYPLR